MFSSESGPSILAYIWTNHINVREGDTAKAVESGSVPEVHHLDFVVTFLVGLAWQLTPRRKLSPN